MRVTIHQPDLLPYSGFWYKMAVSDAFVASRLGGGGGHGYGILPAGTDFGRILERH